MARSVAVMAFALLAMLLPACSSQPAQPQATEPKPSKVEWYQQGCKTFVVVWFEGTDKVLQIPSPISACGRSA